MTKILSINEHENNYQPTIIKLKSRAIINNSEGKILIANYGGVYLFPGGSIEERETPEKAVIREIKEEIGIEFEVLKPLVKMRHFQFNYPTRENTTTDRLVITYYYAGQANQIQMENANQTQEENKENFQVGFYSIDEIKHLIRKNNTQNPRNRYFNEELDTILEYYRQNYKVITKEYDEKIK